MKRSSPEIEDVVRDRMSEWQATGRPDALGTLAEYPELRDFKSLYLNVVLTEYAVRVAAGEEISHSQFCSEFPAHHASIANMLQTEDFLDRCPPFAELAKELRWPGSGEEFLGYEILDSLGRGGLARVFVARELDIGGRLVVLKVSPFGTDEAHALGKVAHESIVPIFTVKEDPLRGLSAICMPLLGVATGIDLIDEAFGKNSPAPDGKTLAKVAHRTRPLKPVPVPATTDSGAASAATYAEAIAMLGVQLAEGLAAAHAAGILHRDIKPSNVLLAWDGRGKLLDFNLATDHERDGLRIGGTLAYMAPEVIESLLRDRGVAARKFDPRFDIHSLGTVLFELLTGRLPHGAAPDQPKPDDSLGWLECKRRPVERLERISQADARLARIVAKCLALNAAERYQTAEELAADLRAYLQPRARVGRLVVRRRREFLLGGIAAGLLGVVGAAIVGSWPSELDVQYQAGLASYKAGDFDAAVKCFSRCLEIKAGWAPALFGRGQALRKGDKFREARNDFLNLTSVEPGWSYAFAGYCSMRANDYQTAFFDFLDAERKGFQNVEFFLNFAEVCRKSKHYDHAARLYAKVLLTDPLNKTVFRERALMHLDMTTNDKTASPDRQMLQDAETYSRLEPTFEGPYLCTRVFADVAFKHPAFEDQAVRYFSEAIRRGMPTNRFHEQSVKRLVPFLDMQVVESAVVEPTDPKWRGRFHIELPASAEWQSFAREYIRSSGPIAENR